MRLAPSLALSSVLLACGGGGGAESFGGSNPGVTSTPEQTGTLGRRVLVVERPLA
jgi:hypothetical protein